MELEVGKTCSTHEMRNEKTKFYLKTLKGRDHMEDLGIDGRII
jgi:hypothetical protein